MRLPCPDTGAWVRHLMGRRWCFFIPEEHLYYFNRRNIATLLSKQGVVFE